MYEETECDTGGLSRFQAEEKIFPFSSPGPLNTQYVVFLRFLVKICDFQGKGKKDWAYYLYTKWPEVSEVSLVFRLCIPHIK